MLWRVTLAVAVVCVGGVGADVMSRLLVPRDYGVKLCGREFIRAVIFTCGGSRWKRSTDFDPFQWSSAGDVAGEQLTLQSRREPKDASYSLADLLTLYGAVGERKRSPPRVPALQGESADAGEPEEILDAAERLVTSRKKRNFSLGVAGMCCNQGCTKNDIGRLC